eukprot:5924177-Prymnesium_polylepis.2
MAESVVVLSASRASARLSGTLLDHPYEGRLQSESANLTLTLSGTSWHANLTSSDTLRAALLAGVYSWQSEANGFNTHFAAAVAAGRILLTILDSQRVQLEVPAFGGIYDISQPETIQVAVPAGVTTLGVNDVTALGSTSINANPEL